MFAAIIQPEWRCSFTNASHSYKATVQYANTHGGYQRANRLHPTNTTHSGIPLRRYRCEGVPYFLLRQKVGKNHATRSLWQNPLYCPFFSTAGHTLTRDTPFLGCSKILVQRTVCPLARRKKGHRDFATFATVAVRGGAWLLQRSPCSRSYVSL